MFLSHLIKIFFILVSGFLLSRFSQALLRKIVKRAVGKKTGMAGNKKRIETLMSAFGGSLKFIIAITALLMVLPELGLEIAPILAGLGLVGLAVGMAAKDIIADFIAGLFIILEDQYRIGDEIKIAGVTGRVSEITLRRTSLKDKQGALYSIPNSQIRIVAKILKS